MDILIWYFGLMNLISVIICIADKTKAIRGGWRIPEKFIWILTVLGGGVGMYLTMKTIRHKTKHFKFMLGIPLIIILQLAAIFLFLIKYIKI